MTIGSDDLHPLLQKLLRTSIEHGASDVHIKPNSMVRLRVDGVLHPLQRHIGTQESEDLVRSTMEERDWEKFLDTWERDYSIDLNGGTGGRFRVNAFHSRSGIGMILRSIKGEPPKLPQLGLPAAVQQIASSKTGLILVVGATGSGKSTTLAAIVDHINSTSAVNIVTIEDPIEFIHEDKRSSVIQREVSSDTRSFESALKSSLRQDPDVILLGEMRDRETVRTALAAAETGHLVMATLHSSTAIESITRMLEMFSDSAEKSQIRMALSVALRAVICQRLIARLDGKGRVAGVELLINEGRIPDAIADHTKFDAIENIMKDDDSYGMQTLEDHLFNLVQNGVVAEGVALGEAINRHDLRVRLRSLRKPTTRPV